MESQHCRHSRDGRLSAPAAKSGGATLLWMIATFVILGGLAAGVATMSPSALMDKLAGERASAAYYASVSGLNYSKNVVALAASGGLGYGWPISNLNGTYSLGNNTSFVLSVTGESPDYNVSSLGIVQAGSANEANYQATAAVDYTPPLPPPNLGDYNFNNPTNRPDYARYSTDPDRDFPDGTDNHDITTKNFTVGKNYNYGFGNIWFTGSRTGKSVDGVSDFSKGFRMFFTFTFITPPGDGFVVSVLNATNNNYRSCGGDSAEGGMLGYAGDSRVYDSKTGVWANRIAEYVDQSGLGKGLHPPKFGVEIDTYTNASNSSWDPAYPTATCLKNISNDSNVPDNDFMNDSSSNGDHVGIVYWGNSTPYLKKTCIGPGATFVGDVSRYSDVRHGVGDGVNYNASNLAYGNPNLQYFNFSENVNYYFRMDVIPNDQGYVVKAWVAKCNSSAKKCFNQVYGGGASPHAGSLSDTQNDFKAKDSFLDMLSYKYVTDSLLLNATQKTLFSKFMWGITSGSGAASQEIDFRNIGVTLRTN